MANNNINNLFFTKDNDIFFSDFAEIANYNSLNFLVLFDENNNNINTNNFNINGETPSALIKKCDFDRVQLKINYIIKIRELNYIIKNIEKNTDGIYNLRLVEAD